MDPIYGAKVEKGIPEEIWRKIVRRKGQRLVSKASATLGFGFKTKECGKRDFKAPFPS